MSNATTTVQIDKHVIQSKIRPPDINARVVLRPRLAIRIRQLAELSGIVWITGSAGSGKTTAAVGAFTETDRPLAWLTLDTTEGAPGRLLLYLQEALARVLPDLPPVATQALAADISHMEAAGLLAEALGRHDVTLVIDEVERIAESESSLATLSAFVRYAPPTTSVILISRRPLRLRLGTSREIGGVGTVGEAQLAFTVDEAAEALRSLGLESTDAQSAVEETGGWVAGVVFDAWHSPRPADGTHGEEGTLDGYLSAEIMGDLSERQRNFLVSTSLLDEVTAPRAEALGQQGASETMLSLQAVHLPLVFARDQFSFRCHRRFREYLQSRLRSSESVGIDPLRSAYGDLLLTEGRYEDAVDLFLDAGELDKAESAAERSVMQILERLDFSVVDRWLAAFRRESIERSEQLTIAELLAANEREAWVTASECADRVLAMIRAREGTPLDPALAVACASAYFFVSRIDDALAVVADAQESAQTEAMRFSICVDLVDDSTSYRDRPPNCGDAIDGLLARVDLAHGRFERLLEPSARLWAANRANRIAALRSLGRLDEALALLGETPIGGWTMTRVHAELMADFNEPEKAWAAVRSGHDLIAKSGSGFKMFDLLLEATLHLRFAGDTKAAAAALDEIDAKPDSGRRLRILEQLDLWRGLIALLEGDAAAAVTHLRRTVALMVEWDRLLFLPTAAVYLAEAEWQLENEDASDEAANLALVAATRQGSNHLLFEALQQFPAVASRRLDAEPGADSAWHKLGRILAAGGRIAGSGLGARAHVREFGEPSIVIDGAQVQAKLTKSIELLACLAAHGGHTTKTELLDALFDSRTDDSARSYLRQALNRLREALPDEAALSIEGDAVSWGGSLTSDSIELRRALQQAAHFRGRPRLEATLDALTVMERGEYLPEARSEWVEERREELRELANDTRHAAAEIAYELGDFTLASDLVQRVLKDDPYREGAWRLSMRLAGEMGDEDRVIARYKACEEALALLGATPASSTRRLLDLLRR